MVCTAARASFSGSGKDRILTADSDYDGLARWDGTSGYLKLAKQNYELFQASQQELKNLCEPMAESEEAAMIQLHDSDKWLEASLDRGMIVVIFTAIALESHINEYASRRLGSGYFDKHIDQLDTLSKWVVVPHLVAGRGLQRDHQAYQLLAELFKWRNKLVHPKASNVDLADVNTDFGRKWKTIEEFFSFVPQTIQVIDELAKAASAIDPADPLFGRVLRWSAA